MALATDLNYSVLKSQEKTEFWIMNDPAHILPAGVVLPGDISLDQLTELEHFAELGRLSACLLHEISNP